VGGKWADGDPRKAFAFHLQDLMRAVQNGTASFEDILDETFHVMLAPFLQDYFPAGTKLTLAGGGAMPRPLGLVLTRGTANLLSAADASNIPDETWRSALDPHRTVYVDVPHGAILLNAGTHAADTLQLRAIFVAPWLPPKMPGHTLFIAQMTDPGSERARGRIGGVLCPDGQIAGYGSARTGLTATDWTLRPPFAHSVTETAVLGRAGTFLRLVLAYHFFGPHAARESIAATPTERLRSGKPRKDESLFALTRLRESGQVGRPQSTIQTSWSLTSRQEVAGHFKLQPYGPQRTLRRLIWVEGYERGPDDAPVKARAYVV
jgi:hypothetical protein